MNGELAKTSSWLSLTNSGYHHHRHATIFLPI
jgi:hypothetical protein